MNSKKLLITVLAALAPFWATAQRDTTEYLPDGTEGEYLEVLESDTADQKWRDKRWRLFPGKITTFKLGGGFLYEFAAYAPDSDLKRQMDSIGTTLEPMFKVRDFRVVASGQFKTKRHITWKIGVLYDGPSRSWLVRETGFMIAVPEISGHLFIGRTKEGFSLNKVMNGYAGWTMERQMAIDVIPILADGIKWLGFLPKQKILWNIGAFGDWLSKGQSFSTFRWQFVSRIGWLPLYSPESSKLIHLGVNYRYGEPADAKMRLRSRPEANPAPYFIDTGQFPSSRSNHVGGELYYSSGPWMIGSEFYFHKFSSVEAGNPVFTGGDFVVSYILTGESRPYNPQIGIYSFVPVNKPVFKGGTGAIEAVVRISTMDLDDGAITGGKFWRLTPMVNWYLTKDVRFEVAYGYGVLERFALKGTTHFFQTRLQLTLL